MIRHAPIWKQKSLQIFSIFKIEVDHYSNSLKTVKKNSSLFLYLVICLGSALNVGCLEICSSMYSRKSHTR